MPMKTMGCTCICSGPFDVYGPHAGTAPTNDLFYRCGTVLVDGSPLGGDGIYTSTDEGWQVDFDTDGTEDQAVIENTIAAYSSSDVWCVRHSNEDHPEAGIGANLLSEGAEFGAAWSFGADAEYDHPSQELQVTTDASTANAFVKHSLASSLTNGTTYFAAVVAKQAEVRYLRVEITNYTGSTSIVAVLDLQSQTISCPLGTQLLVSDVGDGLHQYQWRFTAGTPSATNEFKIQLVDGSGSTVYDGLTDDGAVLVSAQLRAVGVGDGYDLSLVDCANLQVDLFRYVSKTMPAAFPYAWLESPAPTEEGMFATSTGVSRNGHSPDSNVDFDDPPTADPLKQYQFSGRGHAEFSTRWADVDSFGVCAFSAAETLVNPPGSGYTVYSGADVILSYHASGTAVERQWGSPGMIFLKEAPLIPEDEWDWMASPGPVVPPVVGTAMVHIVGASPHDYPNVWGYKPALLDQIAFEAPTSPHVYKVDVRSVAHVCLLTHGAYGVTNQTANINLATREEITLPVIQGSSSAFYTHAVTQNRVFIFDGPGENYVGTAPQTPQCWLGLYKHDAAGSDAIACFWTGEMTVTAIEDIDGDPWVDQDTSGDAYEVREFEWRLIVKYNTTELFNAEVWRASEVGIASSGNVPRVSTVGIAYDGTPVWCERLYSVAPTSSTAGTPSGWRLHYGDSGGGAWTLDTDQTDCLPEFWQSSSRHIYIKNFYLCDPRMTAVSIEGRGVDWVISHDGTIMWPARTVYSTPASDIHLEMPDINLDSVKDSDAIPLTPAVDEWPTRNAAWLTESNLALTSWTLGSGATYTANKLATSGAAVNKTTVQLTTTDVIAVSPLLRYRVTITAEDAEEGWLLFRWPGFHGTGSDAEAWLNLSAGSVGTATGIASSSVEEVTPGKYRFLLELQNTDGDDDTTALFVRVVDSNGATVMNAADGEGAIVYSVLIERKCAT